MLFNEGRTPRIKIHVRRRVIKNSLANWTAITDGDNRERGRFIKVPVIKSQPSHCEICLCADLRLAHIVRYERFFRRGIQTLDSRYLEQKVPLLVSFSHAKRIKA